MQTYLEEHTLEALKEIAEGVGCKEVKMRATWVGYMGLEGLSEFNPLHNSHQWIKCLFWYQDDVRHLKDKTEEERFAMIANAVSSGTSLLVAILELLRGRNDCGSGVGE